MNTIQNYDYLELINLRGLEFLSCFDKDSKEVIVLSDDEYEDVQKTNANIIPFPYKDELVSFREVVEELESQTGQDFETYHKGVVRRIREAGYSTYGIEDDLIKRRWDEWVSENLS